MVGFHGVKSYSIYGCWTKNRGKTPQIIHLLIGFSIIFTIHFGGTIIFGNTHIFFEMMSIPSSKLFKIWGLQSLDFKHTCSVFGVFLQLVIGCYGFAPALANWIVHPAQKAHWVVQAGHTKPRDTTVGINPANQLRLVVFPIIYKVLYIHPRWFSRRISEPSTVATLHTNPPALSKLSTSVRLFFFGATFRWNSWPWWLATNASKAAWPKTVSHTASWEKLQQLEAKNDICWLPTSLFWLERPGSSSSLANQN